MCPRFAWETFTPLLQRVWQVGPSLAAYDSSQPPRLPAREQCFVCSGPLPSQGLAYVLLRPEAVRGCPVTQDDFNKYERRIVYECSMNCHLVNVSRMLPPVHNILQLLAAHQAATPPPPARLYTEWTAIQYLTVRCVVREMLSYEGLVLEHEAFIPATKSRNLAVLTRLRQEAEMEESRRYIDNLLLHEDDDLECGNHVVVWQSIGEYHSPRLQHGEPPTQFKLRLIACPSIDVNAYNVGPMPWLANACKTHPQLHPVYLYEVSVAYLRDKCYKRLIEKGGLEMIPELSRLDRAVRPKARNQSSTPPPPPSVTDPESDPVGSEPLGRSRIQFRI